VGDGVVRLAEAARPGLEARFERAAAEGRVARFVPASGAASRMFAPLVALTAGGDPPERDELERRAAAGDPNAEAGLTFLDRLPELPFADHLAAALAASGLDLEDCRRRGELGPLLAHLLGPEGDGGLDLDARPKGLIPFHRYPGRDAGAAPEHRTAFDEHLVEAAGYARDDSGTCRNHFTVQPDHQPLFRRRLERAGPVFEKRLAARFAVGYSHQSPATDTLAIDPEGRPFRLDDGRLLLRPGGHGALIENLAHLPSRAAGADLGVIKNIDNVVPDRDKPRVARWKKRLGGTLLALQERSFAHLERLERAEGSGLEEAIAEAARFLATELSRPLPPDFAERPAAERRALLAERLDRPLRVCGVVVNQGEPGGGPFWVEDRNGELSLQIVETSEIDRNDPGQRAVLAAATHFNPVDLVCALADRRGHPYRLAGFVDPSKVFIARKSHDGRPLLALERPGLWNGAMAGWNTVFVEVPAATFAPVKTVFDLLRPAHQADDGG
jgi:hypothetical protein